MKECAGNPEFPIWLIGDSPPEAWADKLDTPLDPRHPARHSIWTSVADTMQDRLYCMSRRRLDTSRLYIRNAMSKPLTERGLSEFLRLSEEFLKGLLTDYKPSILLTFGVSAFMIALLAAGESPQRIYDTTKLLGEQFRQRIEQYNHHGVNIIPLLHVSISRGKFLEAHRDFVGANGQPPPNYFEYVGIRLADLLLEKLSDKTIWVK